jgi:predicted amidohydrolase YtcJ
VLEQPAEFVSAYMQALDGAGFKIHAHVIGDRALHTALDGFESLPGDSGLRHSLAHIHLVAPEDYQRVGRLGLYLVFTYAWLSPEFFYDMTVNPFIDRLDGVGDLYRPDSYYMTNVYPAAQLQALGAVLAAGSDAPVDTRDPRPFVNIELAVTRANDAGQVLNPAARIGIRDALDAYTINGARLFGHEAQTGSLEVGKYADLVMVDRDLLGLAEQGRADQISDSNVLLTLFRGREVYRAP